MKKASILHKIALGDDDAKLDNDLHKYWIHTSTFEEVSSPGKIIFLGERGAGKTATQLEAQRQLSDPQNKQIVVSINPSHLAWENFNKGASTASIAERAYIWEFILYCEIFRLGRMERVLRRRKKFNWLEEKLSRLYGKKLYSRQFGESNEISDLFGFAAKVLSGTKFSASLGSGKFEVTLSDLFSSRKDINHLDARGAALYLRQLMKDWMKDDIRILVLIDRLDDFWRGTEADKETLTALFEAVHEIRSVFPDEILNFSIFLRNDIWEVLRFTNKTNMADSIHEIYWDRKLLEDMILKRFAVCMGAKTATKGAWKKVFEVRPGQPNDTTFGYFYNRSLCRPRDIIHFIKRTIDQANRERALRVTTQHVRKVENKYSRYLLNYYTQDLAVALPFYSCLPSVFNGKSSSMTKTTFFNERLKHLREECKSQNIRLPHNAEIYRLLFENCFIGLESGTKRKRNSFFYDLGESREPGKGERVAIHPGLRSALRMR